MSEEKNREKRQDKTLLIQKDIMPENNQKYSNVRIKYRNTHAGDSCSCPVRNYLHDSTGCMSAALQLQYGFAPSSGNHHLRFETALPDSWSHETEEFP